MAEANGPVRGAVQYLGAHYEDFKKTLVELSKIPSISAPGFPAGEVRRSAEATAQALRASGVENVQILEVEGAHPYVYGDWLHKADAPTILLYGHHDVQSEGRHEKCLFLALSLQTNPASPI